MLTFTCLFPLQVLPELSDDDDVDREPGPVYREMTGSGMLMRDRISGEASHTMWVIKPVGPSSTNDAEEVTSSPEAAASGKLGISFHRRLLSTPVSPFPHGRRISTANLLCRICERQVPSWYFEKHNETCHEVHRLEADISERNEQVGDLLEKVQELAKDLETATPASPPVYRDMALFSLPTIPGDAFLSPSKPQQQIIREMQQSVVSQIVDILQTCLDISTPSIKDDALDLAVEHQRLLSPRSEDFMTLVNTWSKPTTEDPALAQLIQDASAASRSKLNAINRMRNTIVYSERVRHEWEDKVEKTLAALSEESDISDSSGSSHDGDEEQEEGEEDESALEVKPIDAARLQPPPLSASPVPMSFDTSSPSSTSLAPSSTAASSHILPSRSPQPSADASTATFLTPSCSSPYVSPPSIPVVSPTIPSHAPIPVSVRPRRLSRMPSHDPVFLSTPPISPPPGHEPSSRHRKLSNAGRASFGSEAQLSPRIPSTAPASRPTTISIKDFEIIKPISKGAFGSVYLAKKTTTGDFFAIKVLKKSDMISKNQITNVKAERKILMNQAESPYVVRLFYTFQNKHYLFLVMEYLPGGDLGALVKKLGTLGEDWTRGYIAEVVLGLESLHNKGVVHRYVCFHAPVHLSSSES
jgi:serine/threonine-protein kinase RIM15